MKRKAFLFLFIVFTISLSAQDVQRVEPPCWWTGMQNPHLQLMVYGEDISSLRPVINYPGVRILKSSLVENPNYIFIDLLMADDVQAGSFDIAFYKGKKLKLSYTYELKEREKGSRERTGFDTHDNVYLMMPDRFANGDPSNDDMPGMLEKADRANPDGRHGGDIKGIIDNLGYLHDLGITAIWINPLLENNMQAYSYHGYAITDFYKVDARFGTNQDYQRLVTEAHNKDIKIIMDMVFNHYGTGHWWMKDLPMDDWVHQHDTFTRSNYRGGTQSDPYASQYDSDLMLKGWFDVTMADINQHNPFMATYLIQNSIWWIEYVGLDGIRMDTYPYSYKDFMAKWMLAVRAEYPDFNVVGESWLPFPSAVAYWLEDSRNKDGYESHVTNVFDFPLMYAISKAFNEKDSWDNGVVKLYDALGRDFLYSDPTRLVVFADNHDGDRLFTKLGEDLNKWKLAMAFLTTIRGIPQIYYGTEILMTGHEHDGHGFIREDFPGGWAEDEKNAFTREGRTNEQNEAFSFLQKLLNYRKSSDVLIDGKLLHFIPEDGVYVYFRLLDDEAVMVVLNNSDEDKTVDLNRFSEVLNNYSRFKNIITNERLKTQNSKLKTLFVKAKSPLIFELSK